MFRLIARDESVVEIYCPTVRSGNPLHIGNGKGEETRFSIRFSPPFNPPHPLAQIGISGCCMDGTVGSEITRQCVQTVVVIT